MYKFLCENKVTVILNYVTEIVKSTLLTTTFVNSPVIQHMLKKVRFFFAVIETIY